MATIGARAYDPSYSYGDSPTYDPSAVTDWGFQSPADRPVYGRGALTGAD